MGNGSNYLYCVNRIKTSIVFLYPLYDGRLTNIVYRVHDIHNVQSPCRKLIFYENALYMLTDLEKEFLMEDPISAIDMLQVRYCNDHDKIKEINKYIIEHNLLDIKDEWARPKLSLIREYNSIDPYIIDAIKCDDVTTFNEIFTREIQSRLLERDRLVDYLYPVIEDCISHHAYNCIDYILAHIYVKSILKYSLLKDITVTNYYFPTISHSMKLVQKMYVQNDVIFNMDQLDRQALACMLTESAIRCHNKEVFEWCVKVFWKNMTHLCHQ